MITSIIHKLLRKRRKYPIKRDEQGLSARKRAFDAFDRGMSPAQVSSEYGIEIKTARRYYSSWKKQPPRLEKRYQALTEVLRKHPDLKHKFILTVVDSLGMPVGEVKQRLQRPWGLKRLLMGEWPNCEEEEIKKKEENRSKAALALVKFVEFCSMSPEEIKAKIEALIDEAIQKGKAQ